MVNIQAYTGIVRGVDYFLTDVIMLQGCYKRYELETESQGQVDFVIEPSTYFVDGAIVQKGDLISAFYDANLAIPLIYPPRFQAMVVARQTKGQNVKVSFFDNNLVSSDGQLKLNIAPSTQMFVCNGQIFEGSPSNHVLVAVYETATESVPSVTTPSQVIILCRG